MDLLDIRPHAEYGHVRYEGAFAFAAQAGETVTVIRSLTTAGHAATAVTLAREALGLLSEVYEQVDDSSGAVGEIADRIEEAHREACQVTGADPVETATWLAGHLLGPAPLPDVDPEDYTDLLGESGRTRYRELITEAWHRNPSGWTERYLMEERLRSDGDLDQLIALLAADLAPHGATHLAIAGELDLAGRGAEALEWAERGLRETAGEPYVDERLVDWVAERYQRSGRSADATAVRRDRLRASPTLLAYRKLREAAGTAGRWPDERPAALRALDTAPATLVDALIDDGDVDAAWTAAPGRATELQWLVLADLVRDERPADALEVYRRAVESRKGLTGDHNYREIAALLVRARDCHRRLGADEEFDAYVADLRAGQRRKRNLLRILDSEGLTAP